TLDPDFSLAKRSMPILARGKWLHGIIDVESEKVFETNDFVELFEGFIPAFFGADIVASDKNVAGINADANGDCILQAVDEIGQMLETPPDSRSLPCSGFEEKTGVSLICEIFELFKTIGDAIQALFFSSI